ncbi:MAG: LacI family transcriptional regulator, partial [Spirochaetales bacterium]|nr:LacI family transcriptional regulator [Spirochaetales bacterium]
MKITIRDIARMTNLSVATVSRVLNNKPDVSDEARELVLSTMKEHNYNPNFMARALTLKKTDSIGLILPEITNPFFPEMAKGVENRAKELNYSVILANLNSDNSSLMETINFLKSKQVDGIVIVQWSQEFAPAIQDDDFPIVAIDREEGKSYVNFDNYGSGYQATSFLISKGHTEIAHLTGDLDTLSAQKRLAGYKRCLGEYGIAINEQFIVEGDFSLESGYEGMQQLLKSTTLPTAVFAANDMVAIGAYDAITEKGLSVPEDISIVGHDDISFASIVRPKLTTVSVPRYELGVACIDVLHTLLAQKAKEPKTVNLQPELKIRDSAQT